jgi:putative addiction module component (TIGR02574 family)
MKTVLPLDEMTIAEKLQVMEELWQSLCQGQTEELSPPWHAEVLKDRETRSSQGKEKILDWNEVKEKIRGSLK